MGTRRDTSVDELDHLGLSAREREIFSLVAERLRNREIADRLHIGLRTVESHVSAILRKLGVEQRDEVVELAGRLARRRISGTPPPAPLSSFIGRDVEVGELAALVGVERLITLVGPPGVGKTRLAFHIARTASGMPPPVLVDLATAAADEDVLWTFTTALGLTEGDAGMRPSLHDAVRAEAAWLVVDNCEHVEGGAASLIRDLLVSAPRLSVLATSRSPLGLDGERVFHLRPLAVPGERDGPDEAVDAPACRLFLDRAQRLSERPITPDHGDHVAELCRRLDGLPLAIELAAAQTRWFSAAELVDQIDDRLVAFDARRPGLPDRHRTVAAAVGWSYDLLHDDERRLLERCAVFSGAFELDVLVDVAAFDGLDAGSIVRLLPRLVDRSLVTARELPDQTTSYRMLDSIRTFARARLAESGDGVAAEERHARGHLERAVVVAGELTTKRQASALAWFDRRWSDLTSAMRWVLARDDADAAWTFIAGIGRRWMIIGTRGEVFDWIERLLARPMPSGSLGISARLTAGHLLCFKDTDLAGPLVAEAQRLLEGGGGDPDGALAASADFTVGKMLALADAGRRREAWAYLDRAAAFFRANGESWHEALALQALGQLGVEADEAIGLYRRSARRFRELQDDVMLANTLTLMTARALAVDPDLPGIDDWLAEAGALAERTGSQWEQLHVDLHQTILGVHRHERWQAEETFGRLALAFGRLGDQRCASRARLGQGDAAIAAGDDEGAVRHLRAAADLALPMAFNPVIAASLRLLAAVDERAGDHEQAARLLGRADVASDVLDLPRRAGLPDADALRRRLGDRLGDGLSTFLAEGRAQAPGFPW